MFDLIERELLNGELWLIGHHSQLLLSFELLDNKEQEIVDIWEVQPQESSHHQELTKPNFKLFWFLSKLNFLFVKAIGCR